jgi:hypothetical protein
MSATTTNEGMTNGVNMINEMYENLKENNLIYIGLFIVILLCILTIYFLYAMIGNYLFLKVGTTVSETTVPVLCNKASSFYGNFADMGNGRRRSYSFWIYIQDMSKNYSQYKTVAAVADKNDYSSTTIYTSASPHIFLDKTNNSLYCRFHSKDCDFSKRNFPSLGEDIVKGTADGTKYMYTGIKIEYIPLQRWVHVAIVVNSDILSTNIYAYVDADLVNTGVTTRSINNSAIDTTSSISTNSVNRYNNIDLSQTKYLLVGGDSSNTKNGPGFNGLLSNFCCYNYDLNQSDINNIYRQGPVNGFLAYLGLGMYGLRNPIYKL